MPETPDANFIPQRGDVVDKMQFNYGDIICISTLMNDEKAIKGDQNIHTFLDYSKYFFEKNIL